VLEAGGFQTFGWEDVWKEGEPCLDPGDSPPQTQRVKLCKDLNWRCLEKKDLQAKNKIGPSTWSLVNNQTELKIRKKNKSRPHRRGVTESKNNSVPSSNGVEREMGRDDSSGQQEVEDCT